MKVLEAYRKITYLHTLNDQLPNEKNTIKEKNSRALDKLYKYINISRDKKGELVILAETSQTKDWIVTALAMWEACINNILRQDTL